MSNAVSYNISGDAQAKATSPNGSKSQFRFIVDPVGNDPAKQNGGPYSPSGPPPQQPTTAPGGTTAGKPAETSPPPSYRLYHVTDAYDQMTKKESLGENTMETLPHVDHYRDLPTGVGGMRKRPTLIELHEELEEGAGDKGDGASPGTGPETGPSGKASKQAPKFGWIVGVFVRCLLNIFGVMLFMRVTWVVGQAGLGLTTVIILLACTVTFLTALSMSAICTNGEVQGGGAYYMISRSLGPEFGGAIGIVFALANAFGVAMYVIGFAETIRDILKDNDMQMIDDLNDVRIIGFITVILLLGIALAGLDWEARAQLVLLAILSIAILNVVIGTFIPPTHKDIEMGFIGYKNISETFKENFTPDFRDGYGFFTTFAIFFPAATGILAGANISGDLRNAQTAIPKGTLLAIGLTTVVYLLIAWLAGLCVLRDAAGPLHVDNVTDFVTHMTTLAAVNVTAPQECIPGVPNTCKYGLLNDMRVTTLISVFGPLTVAGIVSATLSSALASLISAPKVFQAVCKDKVFPYIGFFAKGYGQGNEPRRAYVLTFGIGAACICIGDLNTIAPLISNFFLMSYGLICWCCVDASLAKSPGWRPAFKYYNVWLSLLGTLLCVAVMFVINWWAALVTIALVLILYFYVHYRKPDINWGSSTQAQIYTNALTQSQKLNAVVEHVKNFRPQILVLSGMPRDRPALVDFCSAVTKNICLMVCGHVVLPHEHEDFWQQAKSPSSSNQRLTARRGSQALPTSASQSRLHGRKGSSAFITEPEPLGDMRDVHHLSRVAYDWLIGRKVRSFYNVVSTPTLRLGVQAMMQAVGIGKLKPNTLILGFKSDWKNCPSSEVDDYFNMIHDAFDLNYGVGILRIRGGLDFSQYSAPGVDPAAPTAAAPGQHANGRGGVPYLMTRRRSSAFNAEISGHLADGYHVGSYNNAAATDDSGSGVNGRGPGIEAGEEGAAKPKPRLSNKQLQEMERFHAKKQMGTVDVWWLFDDGGLTLLIPYLLTTKKRWSGCKLRVFIASAKKTEFDLDQEHKHMVTLLTKFRIEYSSVTLVLDIGKAPEYKNVKEFDELISDWVLKPSEGETEQSHPWKVTEAELVTNQEKTYRHIRVHELLREYSPSAALIVLTLPMPRKVTCTAGTYMSWIDTLTRDLPPILLLRGNQESVLTYYS